MDEVLNSNKADIKRFHALVTGKVQGVFFRDYTQKKAEENNLSGWVRNTEDGRVEVVAEGEEGSLKNLLKFLNQGSPTSRVDVVDIKWGDPQGETGVFHIKQ